MTHPSNIHGMAPLLLVFDIEASVAFYCDILGFRIMAAAEPPPHYGWLLMRLNNVELMMEPIYPRNKRPLQAEPARMEAHCDTFLYFGCSATDELYLHLKQNGLNVNEPRIASYGMKQLYLTDPDGYNLCFQWPATQQMFDQWKEWYGVDFSGKV
jgi:catechol 2,3-dioxygenase-like lactoylglutathione lyase family enzyme